MGAKAKIKSWIDYFKAHWNTPKEGEDVSIKEFTSLGLGGMGVNGIAYLGTVISFNVASYLIGPIFGLGVDDIYIVGMIGSIMGLLFNPLHMLITDNLGELPKKTNMFIHILSAILCAAGIGMWFIPDTVGERFVIGLFKILSTFIITNVASVYYRIILMKKFSKKYGKYKPWLLFAGVPIAVLLSAITFFPYQVMSYAQKLVLSNLVFSLLGIFMFNYTGSLSSLSYVVSTSAKERTKIIAITSIVNGLLRSIYGILFPIVAVITGGMLSVTTYRVFIPVFCAVSLALSFFIIHPKERVVQSVEHKPKVEFKRGLKEVLKNKYLWIGNISGILYTLNAVAVPVLSWMFVYTIKMEWAMGVAVAVTGLSSTPANLMTPWLVKKFGLRKTYVGCRFIQVLMFGVLAIGVWQSSIVIYMIGAFISSIFSTPANALNKTYTSITWDYQQYMSGERLDGFMGVFTYLSTPIGLAMGYILPFLLMRGGLTTDWDILFDLSISKTIFLIHIAVAASSVLLSAIPYIFYDIDVAGHEKIIDKLRERADDEETSIENDGESASEESNTICTEEKSIELVDASTSKIDEIYIEGDNILDSETVEEIVTLNKNEEMDSKIEE
ncbi:MAG: MFS transporter [Christensenellales bacterium]|jgi:glucuronide carrier protein|nr:MFS transporter [Clostridiales bacterium]